MVARLLGIRPRDQRDAAVGFSTLLFMMAAHAVLEAARDALFLATLPATLLPWTYLAIAALTLVVTAFQRRVLDLFPRRLTLSLTLVVGAGVTASFWVLSSLSGSALTLVAFYVWTGLLATLMVVQFWLLTGDVMDLGQAKRAFAVIGGGGLLGATLGAGAASGMLLYAPARALPLLASGLLLLAAAVPLFYSKRQVQRGSRTSLARSRERSWFELLGEDPYLRRLLAFVLLGTIAVTGVDYVFKAVVAREVEPAHLGNFFARYYAALNGLALVVQLAIAPRLLRAQGIHRTLLLMPVLLAAASFGFAVVGGLLSVVLLKGVDGSLRHSVNRVGTEILYLPLSNHLRERFKSFIEAVAQRGGQALASIAILGTVALGGGIQAVAWGVAAAAVVWLLTTIGLEARYVELFRQELKRGTIQTRADVPELDLRSLEALVAALSSEEDVEVIAALDMFAAYDKAHLVPALILYHPSNDVVLRALELVASTERRDVMRIAARLLSHRSHEVRAAALRLHASGVPDPAVLRQRLSDDSAAVRATALIGSIHAGLLGRDEAELALRELVSGDSPEARQALAHSFHLLPMEHAWLARELAESDEPDLAAPLARSLARAAHRDHIPALIALLADREARSAAREALVALGDPALDALENAMADPEVPRVVRRHLPRTLSRFPGPRAVRTLQRFLVESEDDPIGFKILRGLGRMRANHPDTPVDRALLERMALRLIERASMLAHAHQLLSFSRTSVPGLATPAAELLLAALSDQEQRTRERIFRLIHILEPGEELEMVYDALQSQDPELFARGRELLEHVAPTSLRAGLLEITDELPALELEADATDAAHRECVTRLSQDESRVLRAIASYRLAEMGQPRQDAEPAQDKRERERELALSLAQVAHAR